MMFVKFFFSKSREFAIKKSEMPSTSVLNRSVNYIVSLNTRHQHQHGTEKEKKKDENHHKCAHVEACT